MAKAAKSVEKLGKKTEKAVRRSVQKVAKKAAKEVAGLKKKITAVGKKLPEKVKLPEKLEKLAAQKDVVIAKLKRELAQKESIIKDSVKTLKEAMEQAEKAVSDSKKKASDELRELKRKADAELGKLQEELSAKGQALLRKARELEEFKKAAESKISELETKVSVKVAPSEKERAGVVTFKGNPMTLVGQEVKVGDRAPDFRVVDNAMQPATLGSFKGKVKIITSVPSLDTPVCSMETRRFNEEASKLPEKVAILTISMDLPFAQARWCAAAGVEQVKTFSDYQDDSFGLAYGVLIKELKLLARAVFIVDDQDVIRYVELVPEITKEPDYDRVLNAARALL